MNQQIKVKNYALDYLKAFAAIFVVLGHSFSYLDEQGQTISVVVKLISILVSSVHVPLFFTVAGYLCHSQPIGQYYKKKIVRILIPYITFATLKLIFNTVVSSFFAHGANLGEEIISYYVVGTAYWFIYCMFAIYLLAPLFWTKGDKPPYRTIVALAVFTVLNIVISIFGEGAFFPQSINVFGLNIDKPFLQLERVIIYFPYFLFGMLFKRYESKIVEFLDKRKRVISVVCGLLLVALSYIVVTDIVSKSAVKIPIALCLMFFLRMLAKALPQKIELLEIIGRYSLQIMFFDSFFKIFFYMAVSEFFTLNAIWAVLIAGVNITMTCICCSVIKRIPFVRVFFGLQK